MSNEEQTRSVVIQALATIADALRLILQEREATQPAFVPQGPALPDHPATKKTRAKKASQPEFQQTPKDVAILNVVAAEQQLDNAIAAEEAEKVITKMTDIKPTKPGKTLADLRIALQECINKHGMPGAKERLAPFAKISDVPDAEIGNVIARLAA